MEQREIGHLWSAVIWLLRLLSPVNNKNINLLFTFRDAKKNL